MIEAPTPTFRAWHRKQKRMLRVYSLNLTSKGISVIADAPAPRYRSFYAASEIVPMQSTGLYDSLEVEIFQHDVVQWYADHIWKTGVVVRARHGFEIHWQSGGLSVRYPLQTFGPLSDSTSIEESKIRVIGHLYQRPSYKLLTV